MQTLERAVGILGGELDIQIKIDEYTVKYVDQVITNAKEVFLTPAEDWQAALNIIKAAQQILPDNEKLAKAEDYYIGFQPISLFDITRLTSTDNFELSNARDNMNNYYENCMAHAWDMSATYLLNKEYNTMSFTVAVQKGYEDASCDMSVEIYGDGVLLYNSGNLTKDTLPINTSVNVTGIEQLKVLLLDGRDINDREAIFANPVLQKTVE